MNRTTVFVTGCQRSGTTLLNLILDSHPAIRGIDEDRFDFPSIYRLLLEPFPGSPSHIALKLPMYAHMLPVIEMFRERRIVWCIRDPFDAVWSMVKLRMPFVGADISWAIHPLGGWREITNTYWAVDERLRGYLNPHMDEFVRTTQKLHELMQSPEGQRKIDRRDCVFMGALCWRIKNELPSLYQGRNVSYHVVRYEDLVTNPGACLADLLAHLGVDWNDGVLEHHSLHEGTSIGETSNVRAIDQNSLGRGKMNLSSDEQALIRQVCHPAASRWDYTLD